MRCLFDYGCVCMVVIYRIKVVNVFFNVCYKLYELRDKVRKDKIGFKDKK